MPSPLARVRTQLRLDNLWFSALDIRLAGRMLAKHPTLTAIATIAVAFAIAVGSVGFEVARQALWPTIPLPDGHAIVALRNWDAAANAPALATRRDFELWRDGLSSITELSAVAVEERNVAVGLAAGQPETVASVTASMFALTRVPAMLGRTLQDADAQGDAPEVVVVGYDFWKNRLNGTPDAIGQVLRISGVSYEVVGVMPKGYGFPAHNGIWRPLRLALMPEASPSLRYVVGRTAGGRSRDEVTTAAAALGARAAERYPETNANLRLQVLSLADAVSELPEMATVLLASINVFLVLVLALLCGNVAMLLFARAVAREAELVVRAALGASRQRLIAQLFAEALVLCAVGATVGLVAAQFVLRRTWTMIEAEAGPLPFWIDSSLSPPTVAYAAALTLLAAAIAGIVPALKVTSGGVGQRLRAASSGGGGVRFGGVWTVVIVAQIALTTMLPVPLIGVGADATRETPAGFPADEYLTATIALDITDAATSAGDSTRGARATRLETSYRALADRIRQEPEVLGVTYANQLPPMRHRWRGIEMDAGPAAAHSTRCVGGYCVGAVSVDPRFFDVVERPVLRGRALTTSDAEQGSRDVLVNEFFVEQVLGGYNPIGRRFRLFASRDSAPDRWYHIVGVVPDLGVNDNTSDFGRARYFEPMLAMGTDPLLVAVHLRGDPLRFVPRLRELAQATDPALRIIEPQPLPALAESGSTFWFRFLIGFAGVTLMLSLAGVYAVTAFAVAKRTREIGVRVALGARPRHVLRTVFRRPLLQVSLGIGAGAVLALGLANNDLSDLRLDDLWRSLFLVLATVLCCAVACIVPTWRALRIQPTEALREDG